MVNSVSRITLKHSYRIWFEVNPGAGFQNKLKKIFEILIFYIKKLKNNLCEYKIYML
jgi:hypothetical protein